LARRFVSCREQRAFVGHRCTLQLASEEEEEEEEPKKKEKAKTFSKAFQRQP
jgi:hypothetical protein